MYIAFVSRWHFITYLCPFLFSFGVTIQRSLMMCFNISHQSSHNLLLLLRTVNILWLYFLLIIYDLIDVLMNLFCVAIKNIQYTSWGFPFVPRKICNFLCWAQEVFIKFSRFFPEFIACISYRLRLAYTREKGLLGVLMLIYIYIYIYIYVCVCACVCVCVCVCVCKCLPDPLCENDKVELNWS